MLITENCTGCRMCEKICPKNCITMKENEEGFLYPEIDNEKCVSCGLCAGRCPQNTEVRTDFEKSAYAVRLKDEDVLMRSASGGAFGAIAEYVLKNGGVVFGASYTEELDVVHTKIESINDLYKLQGSKYVQSDTEDTFSECKKILTDGRMVLYTGTPCQIAGLKQYLNCEYENLITVDLICHGVPSLKLFKKYITWLSEKIGEPIKEYNFRTKEASGWGLEYKAVTENKTKYLGGSADPYYSKFLKGSTYRNCCYSCKYASLNRPGDITIGDFWGVEKHIPEFYDSRGVSAILVNSEKGAEVFDKIKNSMDFTKTTVEAVKDYNKNLEAPTPMPAEREYIYKHIDDMNVKKYISTYFKIPLKLKAKGVIKRLLPSKVLIIIKNILK